MVSFNQHNFVNSVIWIEISRIILTIINIFYTPFYSDLFLKKWTYFHPNYAHLVLCYCSSELQTGRKTPWLNFLSNSWLFDKPTNATCIGYRACVGVKVVYKGWNSATGSGNAHLHVTLTAVSESFGKLRAEAWWLRAGNRTHSKANKNQKPKNAKSTSKRKQTKVGPADAIFHMVMVKALRCTQHNRSQIPDPGSRIPSTISPIQACEDLRRRWQWDGYNAEVDVGAQNDSSNICISPSKHRALQRQNIRCPTAMCLIWSEGWTSGMRKVLRSLWMKVIGWFGKPIDW